MDREIVKTDKRYRRNLFLAYLTALLCGVAFLSWGRPALVSYINNLPAKEHIETIELVEHLFLILFIPAAIYLIAVGRKVCRFRAMPYPGMGVIRDTVIVRGEKALRRGRSMMVLGIAMIAIVIASMLATHVITLRFKHHPLFRPIFYGPEV
ncbi:MAG: hypothetical protein JW913_02180 [Chitinispirillaceae bacterium]|nr:hypothetical protein [Chitinispirillaceae bacterium]